MTNEALSRAKIDAQLKDHGRKVIYANSVGFESILPDRTKPEFVLCDQSGRSRAVAEARRSSINTAFAVLEAVKDRFNNGYPGTSMKIGSILTVD